MRRRCHRLRRAAMVAVSTTLFASGASAEGPVILGGDDLTNHGSRNTGTPGPPSGITVFETEPNDDATTADPIAIGDNYAGDFTIPPPLDSDFMSFAAAGGESILVTLAPGPFTIASLTLYDTDGVTILATTFLVTKGSATFVLPPVPGTYFLGFSDLGFATVSYTLLVRELLGAGELFDGWLYIQKALENIAPEVTIGNDGTVAVLGSTDSTASCCNAGAAYHFAVPLAATTTPLSGVVTFHDGSAAINQFFIDLINGTVNPAIIVTPGSGAPNSLDASEGAALADNAFEIANFVNAGGGLLSHGGSPSISYGWLTALLPGASAPGGCDSTTLTLTAEGIAVFPGLTNDDIQAGPCHNNFLDHGLPVLARDGSGPPSGITVFETEPNDDATTADPIAIGDDYAGDFAIPPPLDSDFMSFAAAGGESILVTLAPGPLFLVLLTLYDTDGVTILAATFVFAKGSATFVLPPVPGTYFLEMRDFGLGPVSYTLLVRELLGTGVDVIIGGVIVLPGQITLSPGVGFNLPGTTHMLTANVVDAGNPLAGIDVTFEVISGPNAGAMGIDTTNAFGDAFFDYLSNGIIGLDVIRASFVDPDTETPISTTARKYWDTDCQPNGIPDTCDLDCFALACAADFPDDCGTSQDCTGNGIPDECEPDCNFNEQADSCDIFFGISQDCNDNGIPDECDIASGESTDFNDNGIPDECELEPAFEEPLTTEAAGGGNFEAIGDFDDNGTPDVAIIIPGETPTAPGVVQVFLNLGVDEAGVWLGLVATEPVCVGLSPSGIAVGLLDADDLPDVAVTNAGEDTVSILINQGTDETGWLGLVSLEPPIPVGSNPSSITAADLTGDGIIDLAVTETETPLGLGSGSAHLPGLRRFVEKVLGTSGGGLVRFLTNDGNAGFSAGGTASTGGVTPTGLSDPEDVDNDKRKDLVGINSTGLTPLAGGTTGNVFVLLADGEGGFGPPLTFDVGENPTDVAVGDFDQDGFPDIAVTNGADGTVSVLINQGTGGGESGTDLYVVEAVLTVGSNPLSVVAADLDGDGDLDLAVVAEDPIIGPAVQTLQNLLQSGDPLAGGLEGETTLAFGSPASFSVEADPQFLVSADLNGDGIFDLATVNVDADEPTGGSVTGLVTDPEPIGLPVHLDIKPGSCPNSFNRTSQGYLPVALVGNKDLNVLLIDLTTIELTRSDGIGGSVTPHEGPPGPHSVFEDVATPFGDPAATDCGCHALLGDGTLDLMMKFRRPTLVSVLNLNNLESGAFVSLKIRGNLVDGTPFEARDCLRLVGNENSGPGRGLD